MRRSSWIIFVAAISLIGCETAKNIEPDFHYYSFVKAYGLDGNQTAVDMMVNPDGTAILLGNSESASTGSQIFVVKIDSTGEVIWKKTYGDGNYFAADVAPAADGVNYAIGGHRVVSGSADSYLLEIDPMGEIVREKVFGYPGVDDITRSIIPLVDGGYLLAGDTDYPTSSNSDQADNIFLFRYQQDLTPYPGFETNPFGLDRTEYAVRLFGDGQGGFFSLFLASNSDNLGGVNFNFVFAEIDDDGDVGTSVNKLLNNSADQTDEVLRDVAYSETGGFVLVGTRYQGQQKRVFVITLSAASSSASPVYTNSGREQLVPFELEGNFEGVSAAHLGDGGFLVVANQEVAVGSGAVDQNIALIKLNRQGIVLWEAPFGSDYTETVAKVQELPSGRILVLATVEIGRNQQKMGLLKLNSNGEFLR